MKKLIISLLIISLLILGSCKKEETVAQLQGEGTSFISYTCPSGEGQTCKVTPILECLTPTNLPQVIFRTNVTPLSDYGSCTSSSQCTYQNQYLSCINFKCTFRNLANMLMGTWIAVDTDRNGILKSYVQQDWTSTQCTPNPVYYYSYLFTTAENTVIPSASVCKDTRTGDIYLTFNGATARYRLQGGAELSNVPIEPYTSKNQEYNGNNNPYTCSEDVLVDGVKKETIAYSSNVAGTKSGIVQTLSEGDKISFSKIYYQVYGVCGECNPDTFQPTCTNQITLQQCKLDTTGCGKLTDIPAPINQICQDNKFIVCNDNLVCTQDTRTSGETSCSYTPISNCCTSDEGCNDNNACTTDSCSSNRCYHIPISTCCNPACDSTKECVNQICIFKLGCTYNNPSCTSPQTCIRNNCVCPTTDPYCPTLGATRCTHLPEGIQTCVKDGACNKWANTDECSTLGAQYICVE